MSGDELKEEMAWHGIEVAAHLGRQALLAGEMERRRTWDDDGASSLAAWMVERTGVSERTGRALGALGARLFDLPHLARAFEAGEVSLDKVTAVVTLATPESDATLTAQAKACSVRELEQLARHHRGVSSGDDEVAEAGRHLRCNDARRTIAGQWPQVDYALIKHAIDEVLKDSDAEGQTPLDQRRADALVRLCGSKGRPGAPGPGADQDADPGAGGPPASWGAGAYLVVAHVALETLLFEGTQAAELERCGLISAETVRRLACAADIAVALDDEDGHTMFEGRAQRFATSTQRREIWRRDRSCRFPGCGHTNFMIVHHLSEWEHGGRSDLSNLVWLCEYHHHRVHRLGWRVIGDANAELTFIGPDGRAMTSRPSPLWTKAKAET
jgi:hypothetical protein